MLSNGCGTQDWIELVTLTCPCPSVLHLIRKGFGKRNGLSVVGFQIEPEVRSQNSVFIAPVLHRTRQNLGRRWKYKVKVLTNPPYVTLMQLFIRMLKNEAYEINGWVWE